MKVSGAVAMADHVEAFGLTEAELRKPSAVRAFLIGDLGEVELPNHDAAIKNLDFTNPRLKIK